jgi:hypothetical protein
MIILFILAGGQSQGRFDGYLLKAGSMYFLAALTATLTIPTKNVSFAIIGGLILYSYLSGKLERQRATFQFNGKFQQFGKTGNLKIEGILLLLTMVFYGFSIAYPQLAVNKVTHWFYTSINNIYDTPIIGWIIAIVGVFFLISMIFRSIATTTKLLNMLAGNAPVGNNDSGNRNDTVNDDGFTDYEIVEDDEEDADSDNGSEQRYIE